MTAINSSSGWANSPDDMQVLVLHSNPADTLLTLEAFKAAGLTHLTCVPEKDAPTVLRRKHAHFMAEVPDLIFLDLSQPRLASLKTLKMIKSNPALMHIPVVVAAATGDPLFVRTAYQLNANCFISKPAELSEFVYCIETLCHFWSRVVTLSPKSATTAGTR